MPSGDGDFQSPLGLLLTFDIRKIVLMFITRRAKIVYVNRHRPLLQRACQEVRGLPQRPHLPSSFACQLFKQPSGTLTKNKMITTDGTDSTDREWVTLCNNLILIRVIREIRG